MTTAPCGNWREPSAPRGRPSAAIRRWRLAATSALASLLLAASLPASAEECPPAALLSGDPDLVQAASLALAEAGLALEASPGCPAVEARLVREGGLVSVHCSDPVGRRIVRQVATVEEAASVIASWAQPDQNAAWLEGWTVDRVPAKESEPAGTEEDEGPGALVSTGWTGHLSWDGDGSTWMGTSLAVCVRMGPLCGGGAGTFRVDGVEPRRGEVAVLASLDLPLQSGRWEIAPGIGLGAATMLGEDSREWGDDDHGSGGWRLRGEGRTRVSYRIAGWVLLDFTVAAEGSPPQAAQFEPGDDSPSGPAADTLFFFRVGAGLRMAIP